MKIMREIMLKLFGYLTIAVLFISCSKDEPPPELIEIPEYNEFFEENLIDYVSYRYQDEVVSVKGDSVSAFVVLRDSGLPSSEINDDIKKFIARSTIDFFLLVNGLYYLDLTVHSEGNKYHISISRNDYAGYYNVKIADLSNSETLNQFLVENHTNEKIELFFNKFVKITPAT